MTDEHPRFGQETVQILPDGEIVVHARSETVEALEGENRAAFLQRLARDYGVGPDDRVHVTYKAGQPKFAVVEWEATLSAPRCEHVTQT